MLVSAFAGREQTLNAYKEAVEQGYRFFSYGDAMFYIDVGRWALSVFVAKAIGLHVATDGCRYHLERI